MSAPTRRAMPLTPAVDPHAWDAIAVRIAGRCDQVRIWTGDGYGDVVEWTDLAPSGAWAVHLADRRGRAGTLVIDVDCKDGDYVETQRQADEITRILDVAGLQYVIAKSGPGGGIHLYVTLAKLVSMRDLAAICEALQRLAPRVDPSPHRNQMTGAIRAPGSPHRSGVGACELLGPIDVAIAKLDARNEHDALLELATMLGVRVGAQLPDSWWSNLKLGSRQTLQDATSKSESQRSLLRVAHRHGMTQQRLRLLLEENDSPHRERLYRKRKGFLDTLDYEWRRIEGDPSPGRQMTTVDRGTWARMVEHLAVDRWRGEGAYATREHLRVLLALAWQYQRLDVSISVRDLAERVGGGRSNVTNHSDLLAELGYLTKHGAAGPQAATYILQMPRGERLDTSSTGPTPTASGMQGVQNLTTPDDIPAANTPEVFWTRVGGVGRRAKNAYELLRARPDTAEGITERLGVSDVRSVRRTHLARLEKLGLVKETDNGTWYAIDADDWTLRRHAFDCGALTKAAKRRQRNRDERDGYDENRRLRYAEDLQTRVVELATGWTPASTLRRELGVKSETFFDARVLTPLVEQGRATRRGDQVRCAPAETGTLQLVIDTPAALSIQQVTTGLRAQLQRRPRHVNELVTALDIRPSLIRRGLEQLRVDGVAWQPAKDRWTLTPDQLPSLPDNAS